MNPTRRSLLGSVGALVAGCASAPPPQTRRRVVWPLPPELPRYVYEATLRDGRSIRDESSDAQLRRLITGDDGAGDRLGKPFAVAARGGRIYVTDTEGRRVFVFDVPRRKTFSFGVRREGELKKPGGIAVDDQGRVYVIDSTARRLVVYDSLGLYIGEIDGSRDWIRPTALAVSREGERVHIVDTGGIETEQHRVLTYGDKGRLIHTLGRRGSGEGEFNLPADAAVGPDGTLWVLDAGNFRVQAFDAGGRFLRMFGSVGNAFGQFARPRGLAVDADGLVYVSDAMFCNIQVFQPDGQLLLPLGGRAEQDAPGRYLLPAKICVDETRRLYVVDQYLHKVEVLRRLSEAEGKQLLASLAG